MSVQPAPSAPQRCHWYANEVGALVHVPLRAVSVLPSRGVPPIVGGDVFCGTAAVLAVATPVRRAAPSRTTRRIDWSLIRGFSPRHRSRTGCRPGSYRLLTESIPDRCSQQLEDRGGEEGNADERHQVAADPRERLFTPVHRGARAPHLGEDALHETLVRAAPVREQQEGLEEEKPREDEPEDQLRVVRRPEQRLDAQQHEQEGDSGGDETEEDDPADDAASVLRGRRRRRLRWRLRRRVRPLLELARDAEPDPSNEAPRLRSGMLWL